MVNLFVLVTVVVLSDVWNVCMRIYHIGMHLCLMEANIVDGDSYR